MEELAALFVEDAVDVVLANCKTYRSFSSHHGLRALPAFHLYPENVRAPFPFKLEFRDNKTAIEYATDIQSIRVLSSDLFGDLGDAAAAVATELQTFEGNLKEKALRRAKVQQAKLDKLQWERKVRIANRTFVAGLQKHGEQMQLCAAAQLDAAAIPTGVNCSAEEPTKPSALIKAEVGLQNSTAVLESLDPLSQVLAVDPQGDSTSAGQISTEHGTPPDSAAPAPHLNTGGVQAAQPVSSQVPAAHFGAAKALAAAAKAELQQRIKRIEFFEDFVDKQASQGSGEILRALNVRASDLYNSVVEQFVDKKRRDEVLLEMSALYPVADALAAAAESST